MSSDSVDRHRVRLVGHTDLGGHGDCMHINVVDDVAFVGHMGGDRVGTSIVDVSMPEHPRVIAQIDTPPGTHSHKVQVVDDLLLVNYERNAVENPTSWQAGLAIFDVSTPAAPKQVGFFPTPGKGVHRMTYWQHPYAFVSGSDDGFSDQFLRVVDLSHPDRPTEVGRWWAPGMHTAGGEVPDWPDGRRSALHHALRRGDRAYCSWWDSGVYILDVHDFGAIEVVSHLEFGADDSRCTHTAMPLTDRDVLIVTDEATVDGPGAALRHIRAVDISDERHPTVLSTFPVPAGDFRSRPRRFGPHNLHEMRPGSFASSNLVFVTYFNAGLRIYDVSDARNPKEIAWYVPEAPPGEAVCQLNDVTVTADGLICVSDRVGGGLYLLEPEFDLY